jgi:hypothetical protein
MKDYSEFNEVMLHPDGTVKFLELFYSRVRPLAFTQAINNWTHCPLRMRRRYGGTSRRIMRRFLKFGGAILIGHKTSQGRIRASPEKVDKVYRSTACTARRWFSPWRALFPANDLSNP